jgi:hypothetical protein
MKTKTKISLILSIIHFSIVGILFILLFTVFTKSEFFFSITIILFDFYFGNYYFGFSILIPPIIIFFSISGIITENNKKINIICLSLSIIYEIGLIIYNLNNSLY